MSDPHQNLCATLEHGIISFPAFVRLPPPAQPDSNPLPDASSTSRVKVITLCARLRPYTHTVPPSTVTPFEQQIASRWDISALRIRAITANLKGERVLIENTQDWEDWANAYFYTPTSNSPSYPSSSTQVDDARIKKHYMFTPIHIHVVLDRCQEQENTLSSLPTCASSNVTPRDNVANAQTGQAPLAFAPLPNARHHPQQQEQQPPLRSQAATLQANATVPLPIPPQAISSETATLANSIVAPILQALVPQLQNLPFTLADALSALPAQLAHTPPNVPDGVTRQPPQEARSAPSQPTTVQQPVPSAGFAATASTEASDTTQRQSLFEGMFDELSRLRSQQPSSSATLQHSAAASQSVERSSNAQEADGTMRNELGQAFAEMLAQQRSTTAASTATSTTVPAESEDESLTIVSTPSISSRRSSRSRSRSRSQSPRGRTSLLSTTTLTLLTMFTLLLSIIVPASASALPSSFSPYDLSLSSREATVPSAPVGPRQNSRHLHLCKCTCFQTNSTLVPLYAPLDPAKPCLTCTRQFCLDQGLDMCKGAKLEHTDHDVGTGLEGDVWAKCFERDSYKDQSIITLYLLVVVALVAFAAMRGRVEGWYQRYQTMGPQGLYQAVRESPWRRASS